MSNRVYILDAMYACNKGACVYRLERAYVYIGVQRKEKECVKFVLFGSLFMYPRRSTSYYVVCAGAVRTQQHRETDALMKRKEIRRCASYLVLADPSLPLVWFSLLNFS
jgi:hypothetical protein